MRLPRRTSPAPCSSAARATTTTRAAAVHARDQDSAAAQLQQAATARHQIEAALAAKQAVMAGLTSAMRAAGQKDGDIHRMQAWAGQSAALAPAEPAADIVHRLWTGACALLG
jgi:nitronate monooxygenase